MTAVYEIQIKQRGGKWVHWVQCGTQEAIRSHWAGVASLRRKARCVVIENGVRKVLAKYEPPKLERRK